MTALDESCRSDMDGREFLAEVPLCICDLNRPMQHRSEGQTISVTSAQTKEAV